MAQPLPKHRAREYETTFIINPEATTASIEQITGRITDTIDKLDGKLLRAENWGKKRLAYPVRKNHKGYYLYLKYLGYSDLVHEIERNLRMLEPVIKYLTVKIDEDIDPSSRTVREEDISFLPQFEEEADAEEKEASPAREQDNETDSDSDEKQESEFDKESDDTEPVAADATDVPDSADATDSDEEDKQPSEEADDMNEAAKDKE